MLSWKVKFWGLTANFSTNKAVSYWPPVYNLGPASSTDKRGGAALTLTRAAALAASSTDDVAKGSASGWIPLVPRAAALMAASTDDKAKGGGWTPLIPSCHGFSVAKAAVAAPAAAAALPAVALPPENGTALVEALASVAALAGVLFF